MLKHELPKDKYTKYELARLIGARAFQIAEGAPPNIELSEDDLERLKYNPIEIAKLEYEKGKTPIHILRKFPKHREEE